MSSIEEGRSIAAASRLLLSQNKILSEWKRFFWILKIIGSCPLVVVRRIRKPQPKNDRNTAEEDLEDNRPIVEFRLFSLTSLYSLFFAFARIFFSFYRRHEWGMQLKGTTGESLTMEDWILRSMSGSALFYQVWDVICIWVTVNKVTVICNRWHSFEQDFTKTFPKFEYKCTLRKWRLLLTVMAFIPIVFITGVSAVIFWQHTLETAMDIWFLVRIIIISPFFTLTVIMEEVKVLLMYRTLTEAFRNLKKAIKEDCIHLGIIFTPYIQGKNGEYIENDEIIDNTNVLSNERVTEWFTILQLIRNQTKLTGNYQALQQIMVLAHAIGVYTMCLFIVIKYVVFESEPHLYIYVCGFMGAMYVFRMVAKIFLAEQITEQERKLSSKLSDIDPRKITMKTKLQLKKMVDIIESQPAKIILAGVVSLENRLLPKITSCIIAYLVVLLQLQLSAEYRKKDELPPCEFTNPDNFTHNCAVFCNQNTSELIFDE